jgi:hypothetical protein
LSENKAGKDAGGQAELTREAVRKLMAQLEPEQLEAAFKEDPDLTREAIESAYLLEMAWVRIIKLFAQYLDGLEPAEREAILKKHIEAVDGSEIAAALNAYSKVVMKVHAENPELVEAAFPAFEAVLKNTDFGKVREATTDMLDYFTVYMTRFIEKMMENPVVVANIVGIVPPVANALIKLVSVTLESTNLPPEILASALFNTITALDAEEVGRIITTGSRMAIDLHAGNYILGGAEPRFRAVFTDVMKRMLDNVDIEAANEALVALGEDGEVMAAVLVELIARDPEKVVLAWRTGTALCNILARVLANAYAEANAWPDELLVRLGTEARELDAEEISRAIDSAITLALRFREANPGLSEDIMSRVVQGIDTERLEFLLTAASSDALAALMSNPGVRQALRPEEMGRRVNRWLTAFNRSPGARPGAIREYVTSLLAEVDNAEFDMAARTISHGMMDAVLATGERVVMILKIGASNLWRLGKLVAKGLASYRAGA